MYKVHQDAKYLSMQLTSPDYVSGDKKLPAVNVSASQDASGKVHISFTNLDLHKDIKISTILKDIKWKSVTGQILTSANITDINTFDKPNAISLKDFKGAKKDGDNLVVVLPAKSVVTLELF
jgi:alpha-N-arabinofuranosidase